jgi:hypothetical protein
MWLVVVRGSLSSGAASLLSLLAILRSPTRQKSGYHLSHFSSHFLNSNISALLSNERTLECVRNDDRSGRMLIGIKLPCSSLLVSSSRRG